MLDLLVKVGKVGLAVGAGALIFEGAAFGCELLKNDGIALKDLGKYLLDPEPYYAKKKGFLQKKETVKINPVTGNISTYTGTRKPVSTKCFRY